LNYEEFHNPYFTPNIIRKIKPMKMRRAGHIARMRDKKFIKVFSGRPGVDSRIIFDRILNETDETLWTGFVRLKFGIGGWGGIKTVMNV
jgi:hypothetical protein